MSQQAETLPVGHTREGSPWTGLWAVVGKEMADQLTSTRMLILEFLIVLTAGGTVWAATQSLTQSVGQDRFLYLKLFTTGRDPVPAFIGFLGILVPIIAIALAFDAINSEFNRRTMSRVLSQPIYRDALLLGKFLAGLFTLSLVLTAIWLLIFGLGIIFLGVAPGGEEVGRILWFLAATIFYGGFWLALALTFSIVFRQPATAALTSLAILLFFLFFWGILAPLIAQRLSPIRYLTSEEVISQEKTESSLLRLSPNRLYAETMYPLLVPELRSLSSISLYLLQFEPRAIPGAPLPLQQSVLLIWPSLTWMIAYTLLLFTLGYVLFQRQEIRA